MADPVRLILASGSKARQSMLRAAGLSFDVVVADIDEAALRAQLLSQYESVDPTDLALYLAAEKAADVAGRYPDALVVGCDQILTTGSRIFNKAASLEQARDTLRALRGITHELISAVALAQGEEVSWSLARAAQMTMRDFSEEFLGHYLETAGEALTKCVGCYEFEGAGAQLFESIDGDYFTILGMPLLELLQELRNRGMITA